MNGFEVGDDYPLVCEVIDDKSRISSSNPTGRFYQFFHALSGKRYAMRPSRDQALAMVQWGVTQDDVDALQKLNTLRRVQPCG